MELIAEAINGLALAVKLLGAAVLVAGMMRAFSSPNDFAAREIASAIEKHARAKERP